MKQRRVVDLGIVGERNERRVVVDVQRRQRLVGPLRNHLHVGEALDRSERRARIDDGHVIAEQSSDRRQRLADVHRAGDDELRRRHIDGEENAALRGFRPCRSAGAQTFGEDRPQRILGNVGGFDQALRAARHIGDDDRSAARRAFGVKGFKKFEFHGSP